MIDKREDTDLPEDAIIDGDQDTNLISSARDPSLDRMRNIKNQQRELEREQKDAEMLAESQYDGPGICSLFNAPKPVEKDFTLDNYYTDPKYKPYRDMDDRDREIARYYRNGKYEGNAGRGPGWHVNPRTAAAIALGTIGAVEIGERQKEFHSVLPDVEARTGVPTRLIGAFWGNESGFGKNLVSPTNCLGDGQFTRGTWAAMIRQYGDRIPGMEKFSEDLRSGKIKPDNAALQAMRMNTKASAYAMGFYIAEVARDLNVDPKDEKNWHLIYAGYTVGPGNARKLRDNKDLNVNATEMLGSVAVNNPMFYDKGRATPAQALSNYDAVIMRSAKAFDTKVAARMDEALVAKAGPKTPEPISVASTVDGPAITSSAKPKEGFGDSKHEIVNTSEAGVSALGKLKTMLYGFVEVDKTPAPKQAPTKPEVPLHSLVYG